MHDLIGKLLRAATDASEQLAQTIVEFLSQVTDETNDRKTDAMCKEMEKAGTAKERDVAVQVPLLSIVPVPALAIEEISVNFDMEVKSSAAGDKTSERNETDSIRMENFFRYP